MKTLFVAFSYNLKLLEQLHNVDLTLMQNRNFEPFYKTLFDQVPDYQLRTLTQRVVNSQEGNIFHRISEIYKIKSILENYIQNSDTILGSDKKLLAETLNLINGEIRTAAINSIVTAGMNRDPADNMLRTIEIAKIKDEQKQIKILRII